MGNFLGVVGTCRSLDNRKFTIKELKRIMSLFEDFKLTGDHKQQSERVGRMVMNIDDEGSRLEMYIIKY